MLAGRLRRPERHLELVAPLVSGARRRALYRSATRADLVLAGCAILEAILGLWPSERLRVADRGLREGILASLMSEDGVYRAGRRRRRPRPE